MKRVRSWESFEAIQILMLKLDVELQLQDVLLLRSVALRLHTKTSVHK